MSGYPVTRTGRKLTAKTRKLDSHFRTVTSGPSPSIWDIRSLGRTCHDHFSDTRLVGGDCLNLKNKYRW
jgi:hypothetical protein